MIDDEIGFDGTPFDSIQYAPSRVGRSPNTVRNRPETRTRSVQSVARSPIAELGRGIRVAHEAMLTTHVAAQRALLRRSRTAPPTFEHIEPDEHIGFAPEGSFKPLARTATLTLDQRDLEMLARGSVAEVFGAAYAQPGANPDVRISSEQPVVLTAVTAINLRGGVFGQGSLQARFTGDGAAAAVQAAEIFALFVGLHLCMVDSTLEAVPPTFEESVLSGDLELIVTYIDLVPRPYLVAEVILDGRLSASTRITLTSKPGAALGPGAGGTLSTWTGRIGATGNRALLNEFHMAHLARGDQAIALGPEFARFTGQRATRLPTGGLLLVDRITQFSGERGILDHIVGYDSEYDSPSDAWYYRDSANDSMPHFVYMEVSLQAALLMGFYLGPTLLAPEGTLSLRNLGGVATVLRRVDLRDKTIHQHSRLLSTTVLPGSSLQTFDYVLSVDGEPFYRGETMFGYFSDNALATQTGLDSGQLKPTWIASNAGSVTRQIDLAARRADPHAELCSRATLALLDRLDVVDDGGQFGLGYIHAIRRIDPDDWFFARHFHLDPVIPGSLGVESALQAIQEWIVDAGFAAEMSDPRFAPAPEIAFTWKYRGQFLPTDQHCELEVHIKTIDRVSGSLTVTADASLWKPGLRIYELVDLSVELRDAAAQ